MDAQTRKGTKQRRTGGVKLPHGLDETKHSFLHQVLSVAADEKIRTGTGTDQPMIPGGQNILRLTPARTTQSTKLFIGQVF